MHRKLKLRLVRTKYPYIQLSLIIFIQFLSFYILTIASYDMVKSISLLLFMYSFLRLIEMIMILSEYSYIMFSQNKRKLYIYHIEKKTKKRLLIIEKPIKYKYEEEEKIIIFNTDTKTSKVLDLKDFIITISLKRKIMRYLNDV